MRRASTEDGRGAARVGGGVLDAVVVVVTHDSQAQLTECVRSLGSRPDGLSTHVVVVDSGSSDLGYLRVVGADTVLTLANHGYGTAINAALNAVRAKWVLILNPDARIGWSDVQLLIRLAEQDADIALLSPELAGSAASGGHFPALPTPPWRRREQVGGGADVLRDVASVHGSVMLARTSALAEVGGFDPGYFLYFEEIDLAWRLRSAGKRVAWTPAVTAAHVGEGSSSGVPDAWRRAQRLRGKARYLRRRYGRLAAVAALAAEVPAGLLRSGRRTFLTAVATDPRRGLRFPAEVRLLD